MNVVTQTEIVSYHYQIKVADKRIKSLSLILSFVREDLHSLLCKDSNSFMELKKMEYLTEREVHVAQKISCLIKRNLFLSHLLIKKQEIEN